MAADVVLTSLSDRVLYVTLNRPAKLNALSVELMDELMRVVHATAADDSVGCLVVQGAGRALCSGWDLTPQADGEGSGHGARPPAELTLREDIDALHARSGRWERLWTLAKPVVAKVHGSTAWPAARIWPCTATLSPPPRTRASAFGRCAPWARPRPTCGPTCERVQHRVCCGRSQTETYRKTGYR